MHKWLTAHWVHIAHTVKFALGTMGRIQIWSGPDANGADVNIETLHVCPKEVTCTQREEVH